MKNMFSTLLILTVWLGASVQTVSQSHSSSNGNGSAREDLTASSARPPASNPVSDEFTIGSGDLLAVSVWKEPELSRVIPVRSDGRISLPLIGELQASGRTPIQLESEITAKLKDFVSEPEVTVIVQEIRSLKFNVLGMVMKPGSYPLTKPMTVIDAIATAGGFRDFAKKKDIYVLRRGPDGNQTRLAFNYKDVIKGHNTAQNVALETNDTVVVP